jgi:hypothetical protein
MDQIVRARVRLEQAVGLPAVLDAAYDAFEKMLSEIEDQQDHGAGAFAAWVMSGAAAANGRNALAAAPSLPAVSGDLAVPAPGPFASENSAAALGRLSQLLTSRLTDASLSSIDVDDKLACAEAARHAASIHSLLSGTPEP